MIGWYHQRVCGLMSLQEARLGLQHWDLLLAWFGAGGDQCVRVSIAKSVWFGRMFSMHLGGSVDIPQCSSQYRVSALFLSRLSSLLGRAGGLLAMQEGEY